MDRIRHNTHEGDRLTSEGQRRRKPGGISPDARVSSMEAKSAGRSKLSRKIIISAAIKLVDENGFEGLNMRELGASLNASTMSVYRYFSNKAELLNAVVDEVIDGMLPKPSDGTWQDQAKSIALRVRSAMLAHPNLADFMGRELRRSTTSLRVNAEVIERLRASGVPSSHLSETFWALASYTNGYSLLEMQARKQSKTSDTLHRRDLRAQKFTEILRSVEDIPESSVVDVAKVLSRPLNEEQFLFGLDCLIYGLERKFIDSKSP